MGKLLLSPLLKWAFGGALFLSLLLGGALLVERRHSAKLARQLTECTQGREVDRLRYQAAQDAAAIQNRKEVAEKESQYRSINERVKNAYQADLARARADYARRVQSQGGTAEGPPCTTGTPENPCPSAGANGSAYVRIPYASGLLGAETELKLIHLQEWVRKQLEAQP